MTYRASAYILNNRQRKEYAIKRQRIAMLKGLIIGAVTAGLLVAMLFGAVGVAGHYELQDRMSYAQ